MLDDLEIRPARRRVGRGQAPRLGTTCRRLSSDSLPGCTSDAVEIPAGASTRLSSLHSVDWAGVVCSSAPPPSLTQRTRPAPTSNFAIAASTTALQQAALEREGNQANHVCMLAFCNACVHRQTDRPHTHKQQAAMRGHLRNGAAMRGVHASRGLSIN